MKLQEKRMISFLHFACISLFFILLCITTYYETSNRSLMLLLGITFRDSNTLSPLWNSFFPVNLYKHKQQKHTHKKIKKTTINAMTPGKSSSLVVFTWAAAAPEENVAFSDVLLCSVVKDIHQHRNYTSIFELFIVQNTSS